MQSESDHGGQVCSLENTSAGSDDSGGIALCQAGHWGESGREKINESINILVITGEVRLQ